MAWCGAGARNKKELLLYVNKLRSDKEHPLEVLSNPGGDVKNVTNCLRAMLRMISILMQTEINEKLISESDLSIQIYLRMVEELNNALRNKKDKPIWITRSNYLSLLNLPDQMRLYGPLRLYWEGGWKGEGIIQEIKEIIRDGLKKNWAMNTLKRAYNGRAFDFLLKESKLEFENYNNIRHYKTYSSIQELNNEMQQHNAISVIILKDCLHVVSIKNEQYVILQRQSVHEVVNGSTYYYWKIEEHNTIMNKFDTNDLLCYGVLLPWYEIIDKEVTHSMTPSYTSISNIWKEFNGYSYEFPNKLKMTDISHME